MSRNFLVFGLAAALLFALLFLFPSEPYWIYAGAAMAVAVAVVKIAKRNPTYRNELQLAVLMAGLVALVTWKSPRAFIAVLLAFQVYRVVDLVIGFKRGVIHVLYARQFVAIERTSDPDRFRSRFRLEIIIVALLALVGAWGMMFLA